MTIGIDPNLFTLGPSVIAWHGILTALGVLAGVMTAVKLAQINHFRITEDQIYSVALWSVPGGIIGARVAHVLDRWDVYSQNPMQMLLINEGGLAVWGSVIGGPLAGLLYVTLNKIPKGEAADVGAFGFLVGQIIGRLGCMVNGDAYGAPSDAPWAVTYTHPGAFAPLNIPTHPWPMYEIVWTLISLAILWRLNGRLKPDGSLFLVYLILYSIGRFVLTFWREERILFMGLQEAHLISIAVFAFAVPMLIWLTAGSRGARSRRAAA
ncbi:MAG: prolipoprotein diacylglyceryl transferase [Chloroflexi bacterium]|nr:prolipoprotein diacylglyceryl transferase [Chloroflexota bacterium]